MDEGGGAAEPARATGLEEIKNLYLASALPGLYTLDAIGTGTGGAYEILIDGGGVSPGAQNRIAGTVSPGQHLVFTFQAVPEPGALMLLGLAAFRTLLRGRWR